MAAEREDYPLLNHERDEEDWAAFLTQFRQEVYEPIFKAQGFTFPEALLAWKMNEICHKLNRLPFDDSWQQ